MRFIVTLPDCMNNFVLKTGLNNRMISVKEARDIILSRVAVLGTERVELFAALGRVLAEDVIAPFDVPPHKNSAMDGYAARSADLRGATPETPVMLTVIEDLPAGYVSAKTLDAGQAIRIMTGAPIPNGADAVIRVEDTRRGDGAQVMILQERPPHFDVRFAGEDLRRGAVAIPKGKMLRPAEIGLFASLGRSFALVYQRPRVAILSTGDELAEVDEPLLPGKIFNANAYSLAAQTFECGAIPMLLGIARDAKADLDAKFAQAARADLILSSGGVSAGDYDFVKDLLRQTGSEMRFWQVCMKPGKPLAFGSIGGTPLFGLPGNPVSSMVSFEVFARPALLKMMGHAAIFRASVTARLTHDFQKDDDRKHFARVTLERRGGELAATSTGAQGSGILASMSKADGLAVIDEPRMFISAGERVPVMVLDNSLLMTPEREF